MRADRPFCFSFGHVPIRLVGEQTKTFATKEKRSARKARPYVYHPTGPVQQVQQAAMRNILRPDEVQAKPDIGEPDGKYEQEADHVADAGAAGNIWRCSSHPAGMPHV